MNRHHRLLLSATAALLFGATAHAQDLDTPLTRAQVAADLEAARASGWTAAFAGEDSGSAWLQRQPATAGPSRDEVRRATAAARADGSLGLANGEDSGSFDLAAHPQPSRVARSEVRRQVAQARASGELGALCAEDSGSFHLARLAPRAHPGADRPVLVAGQPTPGAH